MGVFRTPTGHAPKYAYDQGGGRVSVFYAWRQGGCPHAGALPRSSTPTLQYHAMTDVSRDAMTYYSGWLSCEMRMRPMGPPLFLDPRRSPQPQLRCCWACFPWQPEMFQVWGPKTWTARFRQPGHRHSHCQHPHGSMNISSTRPKAMPQHSAVCMALSHGTCHRLGCCDRLSTGLLIGR